MQLYNILLLNMIIISYSGEGTMKKVKSKAIYSVNKFDVR